MSAERRPDAKATRAAADPLRLHLLKLLDWEDAHAGFARVLADFPAPLRGQRVAGVPYTAWQLLEHLRIAQRDILDFIRKPDYRSPAWPSGYWPAHPRPRPGQWERSLCRFRADLEKIRALVRNPRIDLFACIPHGSGQTYLREVLLVADHNAYHLGQLVLLRRLLGIWPEG